MKDALEQALINRFPNLYRDCYKDPKTSCMSWGFECGDGWYGLIYNLSVALEQVQRELDAEGAGEVIVAEQVKEKFGTIRFYTSHDGLDRVHELIRMAETQSAKTCEDCGNTGALWRRGGWFRTLCDSHAQEFQYETRVERTTK
jgi:hypothetical protein